MKPVIVNHRMLTGNIDQTTGCLLILLIIINQNDQEKLHNLSKVNGRPVT